MRNEPLLGLDLDGVLVPDCDQIPNLGGLTEFYTLTRYMQPFFRPKGDWIIVTGRPACYRGITESWVERQFHEPANRPLDLYHDIGANETPQEYKARIIRLREIDVFVESDKEQALWLGRELKGECNVFQLSHYLSRHLQLVAKTSNRRKGEHDE